MARIRTIKPEFWQNETMARLPADTRLLAIAILNHSDDHGYFQAHPQLVRAACCPFMEGSVNAHGVFREASVIVQEMLRELSSISWIEVRKSNDGRLLGKVVNFKVHQYVQRPQRSKIAEIFEALKPFREPSVNDHGTITERSAQEQGSGNRDQGKDLIASEITLKGNSFLTTSPVTESSAAAEPACRTGGGEPKDSKTVAVPPVMAFPCRGTQKSWNLSAAQVAKWAGQYPGMDVTSECRKALAWLEASPTKQKTSSGMPRFLVNWLNRCADRAGVAQQSRSGAGTAPRTPIESFAAERQRLGRRSRLYLTLKTELKLPEFYARHLSAEFDQLLTEEEAVRAAISSLVGKGLATFDGREVTMTKQESDSESIELPQSQRQARIAQEPLKTNKGLERQGLVSLDELIGQPRKDKSA